jgi:SAM-dependent methyltransferase
MIERPPDRPEDPAADYRLSHLAPEKGESYHATFLRNPYRRMMWGLEKTALDDIRRRFLGGRELRHLDFACGTGRVLAHFAPDARATVGIDVSPSMLAIARRESPGSEILEADLTERDVLGDRTFNLITAFRFFPNAQQALRDAALGALVRHLDRDGVLVFNNHKNLASLRYRLSRRLGRGGVEGMRPREVRELVERGGLEIARTYAFGFTPASEERPLVPAALLNVLERALTRCPAIRGLGENIVFACRKTEAGSAEG